jgi:hypothetical protein
MPQPEYRDVSNNDWDNLRYALRRINERLSQLEGYGGQSKKFSETSMEGNKIVSGPPRMREADDPDFITKGYLRSREAADIINIAVRSSTLNPSASSGDYLLRGFTALASVAVVHGFGKYPVIQVIDNTGTVITPTSIVNNSVNDFTVTFAAPTTGNIIAIS